MLAADFFDKACNNFPDRLMIVEGDTSWSYRAIDCWVTSIASAIAGAGLPAGTRIAVYSPNSALGLACQYAIWRAGCVWSPINYRIGASAAADAMASIGPQWLFIHSRLCDRLDDIRQKNPALKGIVCIDQPMPGLQSLAGWIGDDRPASSFHRGSMEDEACILLTSGTTGAPKGISQSHRALATMVAQFNITMPTAQQPPVHLVVAPLSHAAGMYALSLMAEGATHILLQETSADEILASFEKFKITTVLLPPTLIYILLDHPRICEFDFSSIESITYGSAPMSPSRLREAIGVFGDVMVQGYGQSEALMMCTVLTAADHAEAVRNPALIGRLKSIGREGPLVQVRVMNEHGQFLPHGESGEIVVRGGIVMSNYVGDPEATTEASAHGWHHTGDIGYRDQDGFFYIVDRKKEIIVSGGFNLSPAEIEQTIIDHPLVQDCAVVGIPDPKWGEAVHAVVQPKLGSELLERDLIIYCKDRLGSLKSPKSISFVAHIPRTPTGKVSRADVRAPFWKGQERNV